MWAMGHVRERVVPLALFLEDTSQKQAGKAEGRENAAMCPDQRDLRKAWSPNARRPARTVMSHK